MKYVYIILVNWNGWRDTLVCLESLFQLVDVQYRVIVCDNGSADGSLEKIQAWADGLEKGHNNDLPHGAASDAISKPIKWEAVSSEDILNEDPDSSAAPLVIIDAGKNLGFAGGNNLALRYLYNRNDWEYAWLLNNDTMVPPDSLKQLLARCAENPDIGMCGSTLLYHDSREKVQALAGGYYCKWIGLPWLLGRCRKFSLAGAINARAHVERNINYVMGASLLVTRAFIEDVGLMNEEYFLFYEEADWAWRSKGQYQLGYAPESLVYHKGGSSIGTSSLPWKKTLVCDFYALRNRLLFTRKYCPEALPTIYLSLLGALFLRLCVGRWQHAAMIRDVILGNDKVWEDNISGSGCN